MTFIRVVGLDLSMTRTGIAHCDGRTEAVQTRGKDLDGRLLVIRRQTRRSLGGSRFTANPYSRLPDLVVIEDLPRNAKGGSVTGMVQGVIRADLTEVGIRYVRVTPATLKYFATGNGGASKKMMADAAREYAGLTFATHDECDAWWAWAMGREGLDYPVVELPARQRARAADLLSFVGSPQAA